MADMDVKKYLSNPSLTSQKSAPSSTLDGPAHQATENYHRSDSYKVAPQEDDGRNQISYDTYMRMK